MYNESIIFNFNHIIRYTTCVSEVSYVIPVSSNFPFSSKDFPDYFSNNSCVGKNFHKIILCLLNKNSSFIKFSTNIYVSNKLSSHRQWMNCLFILVIEKNKRNHNNQDL